ncbi:tyrosine-type recombinase/integrase [Roseomonas fluvialis]|uniref:Bacteriophage P4 integrase n=1 Tax=Roseomonas fluvialis TaxID=1750527 RepID=A0ABM8I0V8_9PROT|nr:site-specific integrase [Roseomonas fluvialis]BDG74070.1 bacteriophage P4 integrase [Roseomonas fluvialis]
MAKAAGKLTGRLQAVAVKALVAAGQPGAHADGGNLYLRVAGRNAGKWTLRYAIGGKSREMGLGPYDADGKAGLTLAQAREAAEEPRAILRAGLDPMAERDRKATEAKAEAERLAAHAQAKARVFRDVAAEYIAAHSPGWRNAKHRAQWTATLTTYAYPTIGGQPVDEIATDDVLRCLQPIWTAKPETAKRVRGRIEAVIDYATARGWRETVNPARWRGHLANLLPARSKVRRVQHHAALPWQEIGAFMVDLRKRPGTAARALEFCILTATRTGETLGARWSEIDMGAAVWTIPAERMKAGREHRVPLPGAALAVLAEMAPLCPEEGDGFVFPGAVETRGLSSMAMLMLLRRMGRGDLTTHGFRSAFRDWTEEATSTPHAVAEAALAHTIGDKVEAAYRRGDLFAKRARLMADWADFCANAPAEVHALLVAHPEAAG